MPDGGGVGTLLWKLERENNVAAELHGETYAGGKFLYTVAAGEARGVDGDDDGMLRK